MQYVPTYFMYSLVLESNDDSLNSETVWQRKMLFDFFTDSQQQFFWKVHSSEHWSCTQGVIPDSFFHFPTN